MNWDKIELHVENLIPGLVLGALVLPLVPFGIGAQLPDAAVFIASSYLLGAIANLLARFLLGRVSAQHVRPRAVYELMRDKLPKPLRTVFDASGINNDYSHAIDHALTCGKPHIESEVAKRRLTGRLIRSCLVPGWLFLVVVAASSGVTPSLRAKLLAAAAAGAVYLTLLALYAYAEVTLYQEALRGRRAKGVSAPSEDAGEAQTSARTVSSVATLPAPHSPGLSAYVLALFAPQRFASTLAESDHQLELVRNAPLREASPQRREQHRTEARLIVIERLVMLRSVLVRSAISMASAVAVGVVLRTFYDPPSPAKSTLAILSVFLFAFATLGRLGWKGQSHEGDTSVERLDQQVFHVLYWFGMLVGTLAIY